MASTVKVAAVGREEARGLNGTTGYMKSSRYVFVNESSLNCPQSDDLGIFATSLRCNVLLKPFADETTKVFRISFLRGIVDIYARNFISYPVIDHVSTVSSQVTPKRWVRPEALGMQCIS